MLPLFRTISVGGVLLAITILTLALSPPGGSPRHFATQPAPAHGALIDRDEHPEWRQFLMLAAVRRADAVEQLRQLPDTPVRLPEIPYFESADIILKLPDVAATDAKGDPKIAGLPADGGTTDPDDETGSVSSVPGATMPLEIGETSSTELPVFPAEETPPVIGLPERVEMPAPIEKASESRPKPVPRRHHSKAAIPAKVPAQAQTEAPVPLNLLQAFFNSLLLSPSVSINKAPSAPVAHRPRPAQQKTSAAIRAVAQGR